MEVFFQSGFAWGPRQYIGGAAVLDLCNTSVYHRWPERRRDRLAGPNDLTRWWEAAAAFCSEPEQPLAASDGFVVTELAFRETVLLRDLARSIFSAAAAGEETDRQAIGTLFALSGRLLQHSAIQDGRFGLSQKRGHALPHLICASTMGLLWRGPLDRVRACPNCDFLFLDRSRNRTRKWCDMDVCGNHAKAERLARRRAAS